MYNLYRYFAGSSQEFLLSSPSKESIVDYLCDYYKTDNYVELPSSNGCIIHFTDVEGYFLVEEIY